MIIIDKENKSYYLNCDERYIVYNEINKYFIDYYKNCKKSTLLVLGGLSLYIKE